MELGLHARNPTQRPQYPPGQTLNLFLVEAMTGGLGFMNGRARSLGTSAQDPTRQIPDYQRGKCIRVGRGGNNPEDDQILDRGVTISNDAERSGRVSRKENMTRPRYQDGSLVVRGKRRKVWVLRWREDVLQPNGTVMRIQRAETLGPASKITRQ
jgi:hypothetical protein